MTTPPELSALVERARHPKFSGNDVSYGSGPFMTDDDVRQLRSDAKALADAIERIAAERDELQAALDADSNNPWRFWRDKSLKLVAELTRLRALLEWREWRDIASAPKDGTMFQAWPSTKGDVFPCWRHDGIGWYAVWDVSHFVPQSPTLWQPFPPPPANAGQVKL